MKERKKKRNLEQGGAQKKRSEKIIRKTSPNNSNFRTCKKKFTRPIFRLIFSCSGLILLRIKEIGGVKGAGETER